MVEAVRPATLAAVPRGPGAATQGLCRYARLGDRFIAFALDTAFLFGWFAIVDTWTFMRWGAVAGTELQLTTASLLIALILNTTLLLLYASLLEAAFGATIGKAMIGIMVVGTVRPRSFSACAVRNVLRIVDGLGFYLVGIVVAACSAVHQRVGDIYGQTVVIEENFGTRVRIAALALWIASLAAATWAVPRICLANNFVRPPFLNQVIIHVGGNENSAYFRVGDLAVHVQLASTARSAR